jgi:zinc protease
MANALPGSDDIVRRVLPNGIVVLVRENFDAQSVVMAGSFAAGATFEDPAKHGLASVTAEALLRGTKHRNFNDLHEALEGAGISLDFTGGRFATSFQGKALGEDLPLLMELMSDALLYPTFPEQHVELIKGEVITGLRYREQDTRYRASRAFQELAYPENHIAHRGSSGEIETVAALTPADLAAFHEQQYGPGEMIMVIVGAVKAEEALAIIENTLGGWHNPYQRTDWEQPAVPQPEEILARAVTVPGKTQSDIVLGVPGPTRYAPDYQAAKVANNIFGVFGMMGRLGKSVREEQGLAYYSYSSLEGGLDQGAWRVMAGVSPADVKRAVASIRIELERIINQPFTEEELADNKSNLITRLPLQLETNEGMASNLLAMERYQLGLDYLRGYASEIDALTLDDLQKAVQRYWKPDGFVLTVAGPELSESVL